jgi:hypothetical protein
MSAGGGMGMRTVWIALRAVNYTEQAFRNTVRDVDKLTEAEKKERQGMLLTIDTARLRMQQYTLYLAMLSMVSTRLFGLLQLTQAGAGYMETFNETVKELKTSFADALFESLKPVLDILQEIMKVFINLDPNIRKAIVVIGLLTVGLIGLYSAYKVLSNLQLMNTTMTALNTFMQEKNTVATTKSTVSVWGLVTAHKALAVSIGAALGGFTLAYSMLQGMSPVISGLITVVLALAAAFMYLFVAHSAATLGITAALGAAAGGAAVATVANLKSGAGYARGTRSLPYTGLFLGHKGEKVYNPQTNRPAGLEDEAMGSSRNEIRGSMGGINVTFTGDIHTKSNQEDLDDIVGKKIYRAIKAAS